MTLSPLPSRRPSSHAVQWAWPARLRLDEGCRDDPTADDLGATHGPEPSPPVRSEPDEIRAGATVRGPFKPTSAYHRGHRCTACRETPNRSATSVTDRPDCTSNTAGYRCSVTLISTSTRRSTTPLRWALVQGSDGWSALPLRDEPFTTAAF